MVGLFLSHLYSFTNQLAGFFLKFRLGGFTIY